jgi:hypothetical protein
MGLSIKRKISTLTHSDNDILSVDIPREHMFSTIWIRIAGTLSVTADATARENHILNLIKNIQIKAEGAIVPKSIGGVNAFLIAKYENRVEPSLSAPSGYTAAGSPYTFSASVPISFILPPDYGRNDRYATLFDSDPLKTLQLLITTGDVDDIISAGTATVAATYAIHTKEITGIQNRLTDLNQESEQAKSFSAASSNLEHDMPLGNLYRRFAIRVLNNGTQSDTLLNSIKLKANGTNILADITWDELLDLNKQEYHIETMTTGFAILDLDDRKLFAEMVPSQNLSSLKLVYDVDAPTSSTGLIEVVPSEVVLNPASQKQPA